MKSHNKSHKKLLKNILFVYIITIMPLYNCECVIIPQNINQITKNI